MLPFCMSCLNFLDISANADGFWTLCYSIKSKLQQTFHPELIWQSYLGGWYIYCHSIASVESLVKLCYRYRFLSVYNIQTEERQWSQILTWCVWWFLLTCCALLVFLVIDLNDPSNILKGYLWICSRKHKIWKTSSRPNFSYLLGNLSGWKLLKSDQKPSIAESMQ